MSGSSSKTRGASPRLTLLSLWTRFSIVFIVSQCGTSAFEHVDPQEGFVSGFSTNQSASLFWPSLINGTSLGAHKEMSLRFLRQLSVLEFVEPEQEWEESEEEVVRCEISLIADFPMSLIGEAALLLQRSIWSVLRIREYSVVLLPGYYSSPVVDEDIPNPAELSLQTFKFGFAVLPPKGGTQDVSFMLRKASESAILTRFKELVLSSQAMEQVQVNPYWLLIMPLPTVSVETVRRPILFETWTSTPEPLPYIPRITTTENNGNPRECITITAPCTCAGLPECEWVKVNDVAQCQRGDGGVPCSACDAQQVCQALTCGGLRSACLCARSHLQCHWESQSGTCLEGAGTTKCSACATQSHCQPPEIVSFVPASGVQLTMPDHQQLQLDFDRTVTIRQTGSVSFTCTGQPLPFYVPWEHIEPSPSRTGIRISIAKLLEAQFKTTRQCTLQIGYGVVVDNADVPFIGLEKDLYSFKLGDTLQPNVIYFSPANGQSDVEEGGMVTFTFDEDVVLLSGSQVIILYEGSGQGDSTGNAGAAIAEFKMSSPNVAISGRDVSVDLSQFTKGNEQYSVDLPNRALSDEAGNVFPGIPAGFYTFRTRHTELLENGTVQSFEEYMPLMMAGGAAFVVCLGGLIIWRFCKLKTMKKSSVRPTDMAPGFAFEKDDLELDGSGTFASGTWSFGNQLDADNSNDASGRNWAHKVRSQQSPQAQWQGAFVKSSVARKGLSGAGSASATLNRSSSHGPAINKPATPSGPRPTLGEFQSKSFSKRSYSTYSNLGSGGKENPRDSTNSTSQSQSSQSKPGSKPQTPTAKAPSAADFSGDAAEVKAKKLAVERKLRDLMDKPMAERKKALREMMLEYHPDKSSDEHAKEFFQFINASRSWFLAET